MTTDDTTSHSPTSTLTHTLIPSPLPSPRRKIVRRLPDDEALEERLAQAIGPRAVNRFGPVCCRGMEHSPTLQHQLLVNLTAAKMDAYTEIRAIWKQQCVNSECCTPPSNAMILRVAEFCSFQVEPSLYLLHRLQPRHAILTAKSLEAPLLQNIVVPLPHACTTQAQDVVYMDPCQFHPGVDSITTLTDVLVYVMNAYGYERYRDRHRKMAILIDFTQWESMDDGQFTLLSWMPQVMNILQGLVIPMRAKQILLVTSATNTCNDAAFERTFKMICAMCHPTFSNNRIQRVPQDQLQDFIPEEYQTCLPSQLVGPDGVDTAELMQDFVAYRQALEACDDTSEQQKSVRSPNKSTGTTRPSVHRHASLPQLPMSSPTKTRPTKKREENQNNDIVPPATPLPPPSFEMHCYDESTPDALTPDHDCRTPRQKSERKTTTSLVPFDTMFGDLSPGASPKTETPRSTPHKSPNKKNKTKKKSRISSSSSSMEAEMSKNDVLLLNRSCSAIQSDNKSIVNAQSPVRSIHAGLFETKHTFHDHGSDVKEPTSPVIGKNTSIRKDLGRFSPRKLLQKSSSVLGNLGSASADSTSPIILSPVQSKENILDGSKSKSCHDIISKSNTEGRFSPRKLLARMASVKDAKPCESVSSQDDSPSIPVVDRDAAPLQPWHSSCHVQLVGTNASILKSPPRRMPRQGARPSMPRASSCHELSRRRQQNLYDHVRVKQLARPPREQKLDPTAVGSTYLQFCIPDFASEDNDETHAKSESFDAPTRTSTNGAADSPVQGHPHQHRMDTSQHSFAHENYPSHEYDDDDSDIEEEDLTLSPRKRGLRQLLLKRISTSKLGQTMH